MPVNRLAYSAMLVALLLCESVFGQSAVPAPLLRTFHIQGSIRTYYDSAVPNGKVRFEGDKFSKTVFADDRGFYEADLALGSYTMTTEYEYRSPEPLFVPFGTAAQDPRLRNLQAYERPLFRIASPTNITLNITLDSAELSCDRGYGVGPSASSPEEGEIVCGGRDRFPIPSDDSVPFELLIRYRARRPTKKGFLYEGTRNGAGWNTPVFAAYNLFTLRADSVIYDVQNKTLRASGHVVAVGYDGATQGADSMDFKLENGQATPLP